MLPVLLPYEITLFSNSSVSRNKSLLVLLPYEITLFSNILYNSVNDKGFYYLMKLHYSQTRTSSFGIMIAFYYLMKLHYSQTD